MPFIKYGQPFYPHSNQSQTALSDEPIPDLLGASAWPEWLDSEMAAEKYTTKHAFEDPEHLSFPKSIRKLVAGLKRPVEMDDTQTPQVLVSTGIDDLFYASNAEQTHSKTSQANLTEDETVGWSRLQRANRHLHSSDLYRQTLAAWHCIVQMRKPDDVMPWDLVYPKGKDGQPVYNVSGKYIVKLFWAGTWRRVTVDDRIPLDQTGKPLVLMGAGPGLELWPMLVCKALVKLAAASSRDAQDETGDFDVMAALKGYMPERIGVSRAIEYVLDTMVGPATLTADSKSAHLILARPHSVLNESDIPPMWFRIMGYAPSDYDETPATLTMRALNSSGVKHTGVDGVIDSDEQVVAIDEFLNFFSGIVIYHLSSSFKITKVLSSFAGSASTTTNPSTIANDSSKSQIENDSQGLLVVFSTMGGHKGSNANMPSMTLEPYDWKSIAQSEPVHRLATNAYAASWAVLKPNVGYHLSVYSRQDFQYEEKQKYLSDRGIKIREFEDTCTPQQPNSYHVLFKHVFQVVEPMFLAVGLYVAEAVQASTFLQCINNDTNMRVQSYGLGFEPQVLEPTKNGYTLLAESKSTVARGASRWRVEMLSETINSTLTPDRESLSVKTNVQDIEDVYHPNRRAVLFRSVVRVKDAQVATCAFHVQYLSHMIVRLTLYDNDVEIASECGKGSATIRHAVLYQEDAKQGDKDKKQDDTKTDKKIGTLSGQKHKYVLFAKIEQVLKVSRPGTATMKVSSAKSKKPVKDDSDKYKARYISQDPASLIVVKDTEKDDLFRVIKEGWETHQPGRAVLAKELRDQYTKIVEQGQIKPFALGQNKVWTIVKKGPPKVQIVPNETSDGYIGQIVGSQIAPSVYAGYDGTAAIDAARDWIAKVKQDRVGDKDFRSATKKQQIESLETKLKEMEKFTRIDHARREQYRSRLVQESEELALKLKAFAQQATEAQAIDDFSDKKKKKK